MSSGSRSPDERRLQFLLHLYPRWFRRARGPDLAQSYRDAIGDARREGRRGLRLWGWLFWDAAFTGLRARLSRRRRGEEAFTLRERRWVMHGAGISQELKLAFRSLSRAPLFAGLVVVLLGLGIGANTAIFSVIHAVLLRPLPYTQPERLVWVMNRYLPRGITGAISRPELWEYRQGEPALSALAGLAPASANLTGVQVPVRLEGWAVSPGYFELLGVTPLLGRTFTAEEEGPNRSPVVVIGEALWRSAFGGDPGIVGRSILLDDRAYTVIGVLPGRSRPLGSLLFPGRGSDYWEPLVLDPASFDAKAFQIHGVYAIGRLTDGADVQAAGNELTSSLRRAQRTYAPSADPSRRDVVVVPLHERIAGDVTPVLLLLMAAAGFVLILLCLNVTNLLVARGDARAAEVAVRAALGATRGQLLGYVLSEATLIGLAGGLVGLGVAASLRSILPAVLPVGLPALVDRGLGPPIIGFTLALSLGAGLLAGAVPGIRILRGDILGALGAGVGRGALRSGRRLLWRGLVVLQVASAVTLVAGASLLVRSLHGLRAVDPGYDSSDLLLVRIDASSARYNTPARIRALYEALETSVRALPGVAAVASSWQTPLQTGMSDWPLQAEGSQDAEWLSADPNLVSPSYFATMGIDVVAGRLFQPADFDRSEGVVVVNETAAHRLWPNGNAVGRRVNFDFSTPVWRQVVGVVADVKGRGLGVDARPQWYMTFGASPFARLARLTLSVRTTMGEARLHSSLVRILAGIDPDVPVGPVTSMEHRISGSLIEQRVLSGMLSAFGVLALLLGSSGVFGLIAYTVQTRRREIGLRMAIGASRPGVVRLMVGQALLLGLVGLVLGLAGATGAGRLLEGFLYGVSPADGLTLGAVALVVLGVIGCAGLLPALRAGSLDPLDVLKAD